MGKICFKCLQKTPRHPIANYCWIVYTRYKYISTHPPNIERKFAFGWIEADFIEWGTQQIQNTKYRQKYFRNIYLFNLTNSDSDLSRLPPSCGGKTLLIKHLSWNYRHLALWERGWGGKDLPQMKILASCFLEQKTFPQYSVKVLASPKSSLVDNPLPPPPKAISLMSLVAV